MFNWQLWWGTWFGVCGTCLWQAAVEGWLMGDK